MRAKRRDESWALDWERQVRDARREALDWEREYPSPDRPWLYACEFGHLGCARQDGGPCGEHE